MEQEKTIGYLESIFSAISINRLAETLKQFAQETTTTTEKTQGEVLNEFVTILIRNLSYKEFKRIAPYLFIYPGTPQKVKIEVNLISTSKQDYDYLNENIEQLLKKGEAKNGKY